MDEQEVLRILREIGALREGHFVYSSGLHGPEYIDKSAVLMRPFITSHLCFKIAEEFRNADVETVIAPAIGAIPMTTWAASFLANLTSRDVLAVYAEKERLEISDPEEKGRHCSFGTGRFIIGRAFKEHVVGRNILVLDDILNTGGSAKAVIKAVRDIHGVVVGVGALCNRGKITAAMLGGVPKLFALANIDMETFTPEECAMNGPCSKKIPIDQGLGHGRAFLSA